MVTELCYDPSGFLLQRFNKSADLIIFMCLWGLILLVHVRIFLHCVCLYVGVNGRLLSAADDQGVWNGTRVFGDVWAARPLDVRSHQPERERDTRESCRHNRNPEQLNTTKHFLKKPSWMDTAENVTSVRSRTALWFTAVGSWEWTCCRRTCQSVAPRLFSTLMFEDAFFYHTLRNERLHENRFWEPFSGQFLKRAFRNYKEPCAMERIHG